MPELPDVQVFREHLDATALHRTVATTRVRDESLLDGVSAAALARRLKGRELTETRRHGKHLFVRAGDDGWLRLHFGMTGELQFSEPGGEPDHTALLLEFADGGRLAYVNVRRLGEIGWADDDDAFVAERNLGPDALADGFGPAAFREALAGKTGTVKGALMDQSSIAGVGNVYADETLFQAGIHPETPVDQLDDDALGDLHRTLVRVLERAIDARVEEFPDDFLVPRREEGAECPKCGGEIVRASVAGRPTYWCADHQARG